MHETRNLPLTSWKPAPVIRRPLLSGNRPSMGQVIPEPSGLAVISSGLAATALIWASVLEKPRSLPAREGERSKTVGSPFLHILFLVMGTAAGMKFLHDLGKSGI